MSIRGRILAGTVKSTKMNRTVIVRRNYFHYIKKYQRCGAPPGSPENLLHFVACHWRCARPRRRRTQRGAGDEQTINQLMPAACGRCGLFVPDAPSNHQPLAHRTRLPS